MEDGLRERGTKGRWVKRKGNRWKMGLKKGEPRENWLRRRGTKGERERKGGSLMG
jgi:hypothetical protein